MEIISVKNFSFAYPQQEEMALKNINLKIDDGDFLCICGKSGCGKTTLLRAIKQTDDTGAVKEGKIYFGSVDIKKMAPAEQAKSIGIVSQSPDNQIVTDRVWHEIAFGLENLGVKSDEIRVRVAEIASFFGIQGWFYKKVSELSGGQKQLLVLASVMVMQPKVLLLDEPTSRLDPIAAEDFLNALFKINRELGTTIILCEHRLEGAFAISNRVVVLDEGEIIADSTPYEVGKILKENSHDLFYSMPAAIQIYESVPNAQKMPVTVAEGRRWLIEFAAKNKLKSLAETENYVQTGEVAASMVDVFYKYEKDAPYAVKNLSLKLHCGEIYALVGGNGTGKSTAVSILGGVITPTRGKVKMLGKAAAILPQNPQAMFVKKTVWEDLLDTPFATEGEVENVMGLCRITHLRDRHPFDLSGGEQQRAALAKILLLKPKVLLLDEPTKGFDSAFKAEFANILNTLKGKGVAILMVSHDIEFCAEYADRCGMMFSGEIVSEGVAKELFKNNQFYTTAASRIARGVLQGAVTTDDITKACKEAN